jgi:hypothetical protein
VGVRNLDTDPRAWGADSTEGKRTTHSTGRFDALADQTPKPLMMLSNGDSTAEIQSAALLNRLRHELLLPTL